MKKQETMRMNGKDVRFGDRMFIITPMRYQKGSRIMDGVRLTLVSGILEAVTYSCEGDMDLVSGIARCQIPVIQEDGRILYQKKRIRFFEQDGSPDRLTMAARLSSIEAEKAEASPAFYAGAYTANLNAV